MTAERLTREQLAIDHALGFTTGPDEERALRLVETDALFSAEVAVLRENLAALDRTAQERAPTEQAWSRIEASIETPLPSANAAPMRLRSGWLADLWRDIGFWRPMGLAAGAAAILFATVLTMTATQPPTQPVYVAVLQTEQGRAQAVVNAYADGTVTLVPIEPIGVPEGRIIEVWTLQNREQGPVSIGRMDRARTMKLDLKRLGQPNAGHLFELTVEPPGGSPTGRPTGPILSKGLAGQAM